MDKKKLTTTNNSSSGAKAKQMVPITKEKTVTKQASLTGSASSVKTNTTTTTTMEAHSSENSSSIQSHILFWLDSNIDMEDEEFHVRVAQLQSVISNMHVFNNSDECVKFLSKIKNQKVLMVVSGNLGQQILPSIHKMSQLIAAFIFCGDRSKYDSLTKTWCKVRGIFTDITVLCQSLKQVSRQYDENSIDISFLPTSSISGQNLDQLSQSFMYTKLIKEILFELEYNDASVKELATYCRDKFSDDNNELKNIEQFGNGYHLKSPIWWYTYESCIYKLLNWALREQEFDVIIRMAFFICDLHRHIEKLHSEQMKDFPKEFTVYRGLNMSSDQFEKMKNTKGGLISFNNFLSTSTKPNVAMSFIDLTAINSMSVGVLFIITVDPSNSSAPFANLDEVSCYKTKEKEILFSMQTIFRINDIIQSDDNRIWHVHLRLTSDSDQQLNTLTERMRMEIQGPTALYRLGTLLIKLGDFIKAEEVFNTLLRRASGELEKANIQYQLGYIKDNQGYHDKALKFYQNALTVYCEHLSSDHQNIASCYNNIGLVYDNMKKYREALSFYEKALDIYQKTLPANHPNVASSYNSIGLVYNSLHEYPQAFSFCKRALDIFEKTLPATHPLLATSHNNVGLVYTNMKKYSEAILSHKRAVEIAEQTLLPNHPDLKVYRKNLEAARKAGNK